MPPAFSSTKQAAGFALLLLCLLAAPWLAHQTFLPRRGQTYSSQSIRFEQSPWVQKFILEETNDIDIAFVGSSRICVGVDTPYVQQKLDEKLGRKTVVRTVSWFWAGFDGLYFFTKDLLAHRHVKTLVFYDECSGTIPFEVHTLAPYWFRYGEDGGALSGLPLRYQVVYYYAAIIGMPRNLLELFVTNLPDDPDSQMTGPFARWHSANPETQLGCIGAHVAFHTSPPEGHNTNFTSFAPQNDVTPADLSIFTRTNATNFLFSNKTIPISQLYFARQFGLLAKTHGCHLVALHMPMFDARRSPVMTETRDWPDLMQTDVCLMGIPEGRLFGGLSESEVKRLYDDPGHLNVNGQKYFTPLITPALIQFYESHSQR
jgi:hypothetical protein